MLLNSLFSNYGLLLSHMLEQRTQLELEKKELEIKLELERVLKEKELLSNKLQAEKERTQTMQEVNRVLTLGFFIHLCHFDTLHQRHHPGL